MLQKPEDIFDKSLSQHCLEQILLDLVKAPANRLLILLQTQPPIESLKEISKNRKIATISTDQMDKPDQLNHNGIGDYATHIFHQEGILGFWKGCLFDILTHGIKTLFHSFFVYLYEPLLRVDNTEQKKLGALLREFLLFCAVEGSLQLLQHPLKVIRVRIAALKTPNDPNAPKGFRKASSCARRILQEDGFRGFYRGFDVSLLESLTNVIYLTLQRGVAHQYISDVNDDASLWNNVKDIARERNAGSIVSAYLSVSDTGRSLRKRVKTIVFKILRSLGNLLILYPFRVLQRKIIMSKGEWKVKKTSTQDIIREIWRTEGMKGFYSGVSMQILLDMGTAVVNPALSALAGTILPDNVKEAVNIGQVNETAENTFSDIRSATVEQTSKIKNITETAQSRVKGQAANLSDKVASMEKTTTPHVLDKDL
jgi:hypothetical protein